MKNTITNQMLSRIEQSSKNIYDVSNEIENLSKLISNKFDEEGRIIFIGAGLSSEMARIIIDELWFNFQIKKGKFISLTAAKKYIEDTDTWKELEEVASTSIFELDELGLNESDLVIGLSASGRTQYVVSAIKYAHDIGCVTASVTDVDKSIIGEYSDYIINTKFGNPPILGLNAAEGGTIQKIILDLLIYNAMSISGRIYKNTLVLMKPVTSKIEKYCIESLSTLLNISYDKAKYIFEKNNKSLEISLITNLLNCSAEEAKVKLKENKYNFNKIFEGI